MSGNRPPPNDVGDLLRYDPATGDFFWKVHVSSRSPGDKAGKRDKRGYTLVKIRQRSYTAHRLAFVLMGVDISGMHVDHINGVRTDNRWENLRAVTPAENNKNTRMHKTNKSGVMGVCWCPATHKWRAYVSVGSKPISLGRFGDLFEAVAARKSAVLRFGYHENHGK